ncbi:MAG: PEP-CTERM sorting domain-containing protein [Acidobacteria bacterium]|nr:PEP-CTERM sorting domain-containing protein [Acidobacteriota bacterium]
MRVPYQTAVRIALKSALALAAIAASAGAATSVTYTGISGNNQATLTFNLTSESTLLVTLSNTSLNGATSSSDVLTGFFFSNPAAVTPQSAFVAPGSILVNCGTCPPSITNVSGEWLWAPDVAGLAGPGLSAVFGAVSFGLLNHAIGSDPLLPGRRTGNIDFGLVSNTTSFGQSALTGSPLITQSVVFTLQTTSEFSLGSFAQVGFLWGNNLGNLTLGFRSFDGEAPEPGTFGMMLAGLIGVMLIARARRKSGRSYP